MEYDEDSPESVNKHLQRHDKLEAIFKDFHQRVKEYATGIPVGEIERNHFYVELAGRRVRIKFSSFLKEGGKVLHGRIQCQLQDYDDEEIFIDISEIEFNGDGASNMTDPRNDKDPVYLTGHAKGLFATLILPVFNANQ